MTTFADHSANTDQHQPTCYELFGWPTGIDPTTGGELLRVGTTVDALILRPEFAGEVNGFLVRHLLRAPIIVTSGKWIFLTGPRSVLRLPVWADLQRIEVVWKRRGETIPLPISDTAGARWLNGPHGDLPPWTAVVAAARSVSLRVQH